MTAAAGGPPDNDQSMDDILASIRRIMLDEQARLQDGPGGSPFVAGETPEPIPAPVLILDSSMVVEDLPAGSLAASPSHETVIMISSDRAEITPEPDPVGVALTTLHLRDAFLTETVPADAETGDADVQVAREPENSAQATVLGATGVLSAGLDHASRQVVMSAQAIEALMAPAAAAAAAASVEALLRQLSEERVAVLQSSPASSPTIEEVVRVELRPFLKAWLDEHLPSMVERLVRAEITRLIGRSGF